MIILYQKRIYAPVVFHNVADTLHANAMARFIGYRNSIFKLYIITAGGFNL